MIKKLYKKLLEWGEHRHAVKTLAGVSFIGSTVFPIPPDLFLAPVVLARPNQWWRWAAICTLASVAGAVVGYIMGALAYEWIARPIIEFYGAFDSYHQVQEWYYIYGGWGLLMASITPFPYKIVTIFSGVVQFNIFAFILISLIGRSIRFFLVSFLLWRCGESIQHFIEKRLGIVTTLVCLVLLALFFIIRWLL